MSTVQENGFISKSVPYVITFHSFFQELSHENVIGMRDVFGTGSNVAIVMDFMDTDLEVIIKDTSIILTPAHIKTYTLQTLKGLEYLHQNWILHR